MVLTFRGHGREHQSEVVTWVDSVHDLTCEPSPTPDEHRGAAVRPGPPVAKGEFVDLVTRLLAEEPGQVGVGGSESVDHHKVGILRKVERAVELRDADVPAWRVNAALGRESHQTAGPD